MSRRRALDPDPKEDPEIGTELPIPGLPERRPSIARAVTDHAPRNVAEKDVLPRIEARSQTVPAPDQHSQRSVGNDTPPVKDDTVAEQEVDQHGTKIKFDPSTDHHPRREQQDCTLYIPGPRARDQGTAVSSSPNSTNISRVAICRAEQWSSIQSRYTRWYSNIVQRS